MAEKGHEYLFTGDASLIFQTTADGQRMVWGVPGTRYRFDLHSKQIRLGETPTTHVWMPLATLYPQRGRRTAVNYEPVVECWWSQCMEPAAFTIMDEAVQETYLLAKLLPHMRHTGARRVVRDSTPSRPNRAALYQSAADLEKLLHGSQHEQMTRHEFHQQTTGILGPPDYGEVVRQRHAEMTAKLLGPARAEMEAKGEREGVAQALRQWRQWQKHIGRRSGHMLDKQVLDILSHEAKAALHRAYSAVWYRLIPQLVQEGKVSALSARFLWFWHLEPVGPGEAVQVIADPDDPPADPGPVRFHLFHGHIFGLHPASGVFMQTQTGPRLIEQWLLHPDAPETYRRLLHGLAVAIFHYAGRYEEQADRRRQQPWGVDDVGEIDAMQQQIRRRGKRRQRGPKRSDEA